MPQSVDDALNTLLSDIDPRKRLRALRVLRDVADERVRHAIAQAAQTDMDDTVRQMAQEIEWARQSKLAEPWFCTYCGASNDGGAACAFCGFPRDADARRVGQAPAQKEKNQPIALPDDLFLLHPNSLNFIKGRARHPFPMLNSCALGCTTLFLIPFFLTGLFFLVINAYEWYEWLLLSQNRITTTAYIVDKRIDTESDGDVSYYVLYRFLYDEREYQREERVEGDVYYQVKEGSSRDVIFAPQNPSVSRLEDDGFSVNAPISLTLFTVCWNGFFGFVIYSGSRRVNQLSRLAKSGRVVTGEIVDCQGRKDSEGDFQLSVTYAFTSPQTGQRITKKEKHQRNDLVRAKLPHRGTPAMILYMNDKLFRLL